MKKRIYIKHGTKYMGLCEVEVYNNAPRTRCRDIYSGAEDLPHNYYYGSSAPCEYKVLKHLSKCSCIAEMEDEEFERITQTLKCGRISIAEKGESEEVKE